MRKFAASVIVVLMVVAFATGDEITGIVTKFDNGKVTFTDVKGMMAFKQGETDKVPETTLPVAANVKFLKGKFNTDGGFSIEADGDYPGGKDAFTKAVADAAKKKAEAKKDDNAKGKKGGFGGIFGGGVFAQVITEGEGDKAKITEIRVIDTSAFKKK